MQARLGQAWKVEQQLKPCGALKASDLCICCKGQAVIWQLQCRRIQAMDHLSQSLQAANGAGLQDHNFITAHGSPPR